MKIHASLIASIGISLIGHSSANAADLPRADPDRAAILQAARPAPDVKFVVKDLRKFGDFAFLCALQQTSDGGINGTDEAIDVYKWTFVRNAGKWHAIEAGGGFAKDAQHVPCDIDRIDLGPAPSKIESAEDIVSLTVALVKEQIKSDLDYRQLVDANDPVLRALQSKNVLRDMSIEHEKKPFDPVQLQVAKESCASRSCVEDTQKAFQLLSHARTDATVSSLVWAGCQYGLRALSMVVIQRCVSSVSRLPYCRPQMKLNADRKDIAHCVADIRARCEKDIPGLCK